MFAGPNGSGKSTIKEVVPEPIRGTYINPDDLAKALTSAAGQDFGDFELDFDLQEFQSFVAASEFLTSKGTPTLARMLHLRKNALFYPPGGDVGYLASAISDFLRRKMLSERRWFSFETVMSSRDKVDLLREAQYQGYRTYLYYIATDDVRINLERVAARVIQNGHDVPEAKIRARYVRSLGLLAEAIYYSNRAYLFDNSGGEDDLLWVGEITNGRTLDLRTQNVPEWVEKYVIQPMTGGAA